MFFLTDNEDEECMCSRMFALFVGSLHSYLLALIRTHNANHSSLQLISWPRRLSIFCQQSYNKTFPFVLLRYQRR